MKQLNIYSGNVQSLLQFIDNYCKNILASSFNVQKQDFILGYVEGSVTVMKII